MAEKKIKETVREGKTVYLTKDGREISEEEFKKREAQSSKLKAESKNQSAAALR